MTAPAASIIIPHYNDVTRLERCLASLMQDGLDAVEIIVVDNGSSQSLDDVIQAYPMVRFVVETEKGAAAARNRGVAETSAPLIFFIDADCVAGPDWINTALAVAPTSDLIGGRIDVFDETAAPRSGAEGFETVFAFNARNYVEVQGFSVTANLVTHRAVFEDVGGFRGGVSEDLDWSKRAVAKGYRLIYRDDLAVSHPTRSDWAALKHKWRRLTREMYQVNGTGPKSRVIWAVRALAMPFSALAHLPRVFRNADLRDAREKLRAASTLVRLRLTRMVWMLRQVVGGNV